MAGKNWCKLLSSQLIFISLVTLVLVSSVYSAHILRFDKNPDGTPNTKVQKRCHYHDPCAWAVYMPLTRVVDYFMQNTCDCAKEDVCIRTDDDISVSAYVYRCRDPPPPPTTTT